MLNKQRSLVLQPGTSLVALVILVVLSACGMVGSDDPDVLEIRNMKASNVVPKTSASQFVSTFERLCLGGEQTLAAREARARDMGYVRVPREGRRDRDIVKYVSDDRKPLVMFMSTTRVDACSVGAQSRTGQTHYVQSMMLKRFPNAQRFDPKKLGKSTEDAWLVGSNPTRVIYTSRDIPLGQPSTLLLATATIK